jgi:hypothetical protein
MADISKYCDAVQGFQFKPDVQVTLGHIIALKVGDTEFAADMSVTDPESPKGDPVKVVGVASDVSWQGGIVDPLSISCQISIDNKNAVGMLLMSDMNSIEVEINFNVYDYDLQAKKYFKSFHANDTALLGLLQVQGENLGLYLDDQPSGEVQSPANFPLQILIVPKEEEQQLHWAVSDTAKKALQWGLTLGA